MRLTFTFTDTPDISTLRKDDLYTTSFDVPDEALRLVDVKECVLAIGKLAATFTTTNLYLTCYELNLINHPLKLTGTSVLRAYISTRIFALFFISHPQSKVLHLLKILIPTETVVPRDMMKVIRKKRVKRTEHPDAFHYRHKIASDWCKTEDQYVYAKNLAEMAEHLTVLLNAEAGSQWSCMGFHPYWPDATVNNMLEKRYKERRAVELRNVREEAKRLKREETIKARAETIIDPNAAPQHGAGRRPGARPGIYKGVSMRSQLEIRFAAELDERNIRWFYESEALGDAGYLVDFYLPDLGVWVEVKGTIIAKDRQVLPDVAKHLKETRQHRLMMYMQSKAYVINPSGFREIDAKKFWDELVK